MKHANILKYQIAKVCVVYKNIDFSAIATTPKKAVANFTRDPKTGKGIILCLYKAVSYTHLTLPTIYSV